MSQPPFPLAAGVDVPIFPYTYADLVLRTGSRVHFPRVSAGTGYTDAEYEHTASDHAVTRAAFPE
ncbi:MAG TPA: hypothetical protein VFO67_18925 [Gemmatimonadales bacterium]|nr:hypothetical protein [Gemmatimonadales bacterium]